MGLGIYNFYASQRGTRRTSIGGAVTAERLKWISEIRDSRATFCGTAHSWRFSTVKGSPEERAKIEELDRLRPLIALTLCQRESAEVAVESQVGLVVSMISGHKSATDEEFRDALLQLIRKTQDLLNTEWQRVAYEAQHGLLADDVQAKNNRGLTMRCSTAPCVTAPASAATFPPTMQVPRRTPRSLSLWALDGR